MHFFFESVWKLHIGEIPEKRFDVRKFSEGIEKYNQEIAAIKQNALTVGNPELITVFPKPHIKGFIIPKNFKPGEFYFWPGGADILEKIPPVAILTLPEEKTKNLTMKTEPIAIFNPREITPEVYRLSFADAAKEVMEEVERAKELFPSMFINQHEAIAVIREEYLELEQECFKNQRNYDLAAQRKEAKQLAAMAIRLMIELT